MFGEMALQLGVCDAIAEYPSVVPNTHVHSLAPGDQMSSSNLHSQLHSIEPHT